MKTITSFATLLIFLMRQFFIYPANISQKVNSDIPTSLYTYDLSLDGASFQLVLPFEVNQFVTSGSDELVQIATSYDPKNYFEVSILVVPDSPIELATRAFGDEILKGVSYREALQGLRNQQGSITLHTQTAKMFSKDIDGISNKISLNVPGNEEQFLIIDEWITQLSNRVWLLRISQLAVNHTTSSSLYNYINVIDIDSNQPSISADLYNQKGDSNATTENNLLAAGDLPFPSWWSGDCDVNNFPGSYPLGVSYRGVKACGPLRILGGATRTVNFGTGVSQIEWECPELSKRYLYLAYGTPPYSAHGKDVVANYPGSNLSKITNGTVGKAPVAGDVLSYGASDPYGHTSIVSSSNIDSNGNGSITVIEQNWSSNGTRTHTVSNWTVSATLGVIGWLHDPNNGNTVPRPSDTTWCANEGGRCNFSGTGIVYYGANNSYYYKENVSNGIDCNNDVFGDPISGVQKACYYKITSGGSCNNPSPNSDQVGIYADANYCGSYKIFGQGEWANPGAMGFSNDSVSSVKVGGNVKAVLCKDDNYAGGCEEFTGNDSNLSDNSIGDNSVSSMKVQSRGSSSGSWTARYFEGDSGWWDPNSLLNATPRCQENLGGGLDKNYGSNAPCGGMNGDNWVADYRGTISFPAGNYVFIADHDDGFKLWIGENNVNIMDRGGSGSNDKACPAIYLNGTYNLRAILREQGGDARVKLWWTTDTSVCVQPPGSPSLSAPSNNATVGRYDNVILSWNSVSGASEYYAEFSGGPGYSVNSGWTSGTSYTVGSTFWGGVYTWRVKARNSAGESGWSETRTLYRKYGAPSNLTLSGATQTQVNLSWSASSDAPGNIDGYRIYRNGSAIATVGSSTTGYTDNGLSCGGSYSYYVKAYKGSLESDPSETRNLSTSACSAGTPVLVSPADGAIFNEGQSITLSWTDTGDQFYGEISGGPAGTITFGWQAETTRNIGSQWAGYNYTWKVKARNSVGESGFSNTRNFIVRPGQPTNLTATSPSCTRVNLSWSDNSGNEQGYQVYRSSALVATLGSNVTSYQDNSVSGESSYTYTVYAYRGSIQSPASSSASVTTSVCPPGNDNLSNPTSVNSLPYTITQSTRGATIEAGEPTYPIGSNNGSSVWFSFKPVSTGIFSVDTYGSDYDTVLHVFEKGTAVTPIQGDDDEPAPNNTQSKVIFTGKSNVTYLISVTHYGNGSGGSLKLNIALVPCASTSLCVTATSPWYRPLTYYGTLFDSAGQLIQWFPLDDYGFGSVGNLSSGLYTVIISDYGVLKKVEGVSGPGALGVTTVGLPTTVVSLKDLQSNPINAGVTLTNGYGQFNLGVSYTSSPMVVYATPDDYIVRLTNYDNSEKYLTYHRVTVNPGGSQATDTFDVSQSPALIYNYHIQTIPNAQLVLWSGNTGNGPVMSDGETAVLSFPTDMSFWADHIIGLDDTNDTWYYLFSRGNLSIQQFRQESEVYIGGDLQVGVTPYQAPYGRGDSAQISHYLKDSYNNSLMDLWTQAKPSTQSLLSAENSEDAKYNLGEQVIYKEGDNSYLVSTSRELSQNIEDISPQAVNPITSIVEILNPSNIQQFQETKSEWRGLSTWTIPNNAPIGTWTAKVTMNYLGKWQGPTIGTNTFQVKDTPAPSNDDFNTPVVISQVPYSTSLDTFGATQAVDDPTIPKCNLNRAQATVWYRYTPSQSGTLSADTVGSDYDTVLAVWSGSRGNLTLVECNDDRSFTPHDQDSELVASLRAGTTYYIMAGKYSGDLSTNVVSGVSSEKQVIQPMTMGAGTLQLHLDYTVSAPGAAEPISPNSTMLIRTPTFTWVPGINSTRYLIRIKTGANDIVFEKWLDAMDVCTADLCTYLVDKSLDNGEYTWQLQTWNTSGYGPWSSVVQFSVNSSESNEKKVFLPLVVR